MFHRYFLMFCSLSIISLLAACEASGPTIIPGPDAVTSQTDSAQSSVTPELLITSPQRGTWLTRSDLPTSTPLKVQGSIIHPEATSAIITINKVQATNSQGDFTHTLSPKDGINIVSARVETVDGERAVDGRAFIYGDFNTPAIPLPDAVKVHANPSFLDDNDPDLDDVASIAEAVISNPGSLSGVLEPIDTSFAILTPTAVSLNDVDLDILPIEGALRFEATVDGFRLDANIAGKGELDTLLFGQASISSSTLQLTLVLSASVVDGVPDVRVDYTDLVMEDFELQSEAIDSLVEEYPALGSALVEGSTLDTLVKDYVSDTFEDIVSSLFRDLLAGFLESFAYDTAFGEAPRLFVNLTLSTVAITKEGLDIGLSAAVSSPTAPAVPIDPDRSGSLATPYIEPEGIVSDAPVWFMIDDDLLNQVAYAYWTGGVMTGLDLAGADLEVLDQAALPKVFSPLARVEIDTLLPPTVTAQLETNTDYPFLIGIGDVLVTIHTENGRRFACSLNAETGFWLDFLDSTSLAPAIDTSPRNMTLAVGCDDVPPGFDPGSVAALLRVGIPPLLRNAASDFKYPLPELPIGEFIPIETLSNATLAFSSLNGQVVGTDGKLVLIEASPVLNLLGASPTPTR